MDTFDKYVDEVDQRMVDETHSKVLKYGEITNDFQWKEDKSYYRLRIIHWNDIVYADWMKDGVVIFCYIVSDKKNYDKRIEMSNEI